MSEQRPPRGQYPPPNAYASDSYGQGQVNPNQPGPYQQRPGQAGPYQQGQYHQGQDPAARLDRSYRPLPADQDRYQVRTTRRGRGSLWMILTFIFVANLMIILFTMIAMPMINH